MCLFSASLLRPETGRHKGAPFKMIKAVPLDLFPGTKHCELVILFSRSDSTSATDPPAAVMADVVACVGDDAVRDGTVKSIPEECECCK